MLGNIEVLVVVMAGVVVITGGRPCQELKDKGEREKYLLGTGTGTGTGAGAVDCYVT